MNEAIAVSPGMSVKPHRWQRGIGLAAGILALATFGVWLNERVSNGASGKAATTHWALVQSRTVETIVSATGTVKLKTGAEVRVGSQLSGIVQKLNVSIGSRVKRGDVIAEIDSQSIVAKVAEAQAQLARDQVALVKAERDDGRMQRLVAANATSQQQADDARANLELARATVVSSERALRSAEVDLNYVTIRAPIGGTVASVSTQQGETVAAAFATPTFATIIADNALEVVAMVDEADIGSVRVGQPVTFTTETYPDRDFHGQVVRIAPVATIVSGVVNYETGIAIDGDKSLLKPDMTTNVSIRTASRTGMFVPASAVRQGDRGAFVIVRAKGGGQIARHIVLGSRKAGEVEIARGIPSSDSVLVEEKP